LWSVIAAVQRRRAAGDGPVPERAEQQALAALDEAWFFGLSLELSDGDADGAPGTAKETK